MKNLLSVCCQKNTLMRFICITNLNKSHCEIHYSSVHITAVIKHHYTQWDPPAWLIFCKTEQQLGLNTFSMSRIMCTHCINYTIICTGARKSRREGRGLRKLSSKATLCISRSLSRNKPPYRWYSDIFPHKNICRRWHSNILAVIVFNPSPPFFASHLRGV